MIKKLLLVIPLFLLFTVTNFAGTTGKIAGIVTDSESGEPLPGINIILEGTNLGAATDINGYYLINNISPGKYKILASGVGFQKKAFTEVHVSADFTTSLDFKMSVASIEVETVVVQAQTPLVRKDLTSSHTQIDSKTIKSLPVESISQMLTLQAGITQDAGGAIHIRGGRANETAYSVNGMSISNPYDNTQTVSIATNAVQELSVISGTFNAEYGNALSGIVNTITKEGSNNFSGSVSFYTGDYLSNRSDIFNNIDEINPLNNSTTEFTLSGPIISNKINFFVSGRYSDDNGYLYGIRQHNVSDFVSKNPIDPNDISVLSTGDGEKVPMNSGWSYTSTGKLTFRPLTTLKVNMDVIYSENKYTPYDHSLKYNPDANNPRMGWGLLGMIELNHALSNKTFYTFRASYNIDDFKRYLYGLVDANGNAVDYYAGMSLDGLYADQRYEPDYKSTVLPAPIAFSAGGTYQGGSQSHFYQRTKILGAKFDMTSQFSKEHEIKFGAQLRTYDIAMTSFSILRDTTTYKVATIAPENSNSNNKYNKTPIEFSAYLQDKMEFESIILNVGLRYDYFNSNSQYSTNIFLPTPNDPLVPEDKKDGLLADAEAKHQLSPRLGVSFPITDQGIIHFSYGHFYQLPSLSYLYTNSEFEYSVGAPTYGNANLNPERTVTYEIGLQQALADNIAFNVTGYYKDVRDLLASQQIRISGTQTYYTYVNKDYGNIKGIIFSLTKRKTLDDNWGLTLDYTYQIGEGNDVNSDAFFLDLSSGRQSEKVPVLLSWDKSHQLNSTFNVGIAGNWNAAIIGKFATGLPYTPLLYDKQVYLEQNSDRRPTYFNFDFLFEKAFSIENLNIVAFLKVYNLFDQLNENSVYATTGRSTYTLDANRAEALETDRIAAIVEGVHTSSDYYNRPDYYRVPREVRVGLTLEF